MAPTTPFISPSPAAESKTILISGSALPTRSQLDHLRRRQRHSARRRYLRFGHERRAYDSGANTVFFTTGTLASGGTTSFDLILAIAATFTGTLTNTATVTPPAGVTDPTGGNNTSTDTDTATPQADLSLTKSNGTPSAIPGTNTTYTITVSNQGRSTITGATVSDVVPAGTTFVSATNGASLTLARRPSTSQQARWRKGSRTASSSRSTSIRP